MRILPCVKNWLYPTLKLRWIPTMLALSLLGALIAGAYGVVHDQITYSISEEYFTKLKFAQFDYADFGLPRRVYVGEVGFLATWWVGFVGAWFLSRMAVPLLPLDAVRGRIWRGFAIILTCAALAFAAGWLCGILLINRVDLSGWEKTIVELDVKDIRSFVRVAWIHNAGYFGALIGLIMALIGLKRHLRSHTPSTNNVRHIS